MKTFGNTFVVAIAIVGLLAIFFWPIVLTIFPWMQDVPIIVLLSGWWAALAVMLILTRGWRWL